MSNSGRLFLRVFAVNCGLLFFAAHPLAAQSAPVAARDLARGETLAAEDIRGGDAAEPGVAPGWVTRRVIGEGEPLRPPAVAPPVLISSGDQVVVVSRSGGVEIRLRGTAMGAATEGERVTVRIDSHRRLEGVAAGPGLVHMNGVSR